MIKIVDGIAVDMTPEEVAAIEAEWAANASLPAPIPPSISRRQCAREMFARQIISGPEMVAMTATGTPPAMVEAALAGLPEAEQWVARADFAAGTYERSNPLLVALMTATGASPADIDDFFRSAAAL
jgi:hypothetical protein